MASCSVFAEAGRFPERKFQLWSDAEGAFVLLLIDDFARKKVEGYNVSRCVACLFLRAARWPAAPR